MYEAVGTVHSPFLSFFFFFFFTEYAGNKKAQGVKRWRRVLPLLVLDFEFACTRLFPPFLHLHDTSTAAAATATISRVREKAAFLWRSSRIGLIDNNGRNAASRRRRRRKEEVAICKVCKVKSVGTGRDFQEFPFSFRFRSSLRPLKQKSPK